MAEPTIQLGGGNWAGKTDNLLGYYKEGERFYKQDFTFSRSTTGTYTDKDGYIQEMPYNLLQQSNDFDTTWNLSAGIDLTSGQSGYDGTNDAWLLKRNTTGARYVQQTLTRPSGQYSFSVYLKAESTDWVYIWAYDGSTTVNAYFDLNNGVVGNTSGLDSTNVVSVGDDWYRCTITFTQAITSVRIYPAYANGSIATGTDNGIYIQNAQLVKGTSAKTYFPTTTRLNMPRVDYLNNSNGSLILEPQRTNLIAQSSAFDNAYWTKSNSSVVSGFTSPDGTANAFKLVENTSTSAHNVFRNSSTVTLAEYSFSCFVKTNGRNVKLDFFGGTNNAIFNLTTGVVISTNGTGLTAKIETLSNGWYRCSVTQVQTSTTIYPNIICVDGSNNSTYTGDGSSGIYIYGAQVEQGSYPTTLINTLGSSVTRNAESCELTVPNNISIENEGSIYFEFNPLAIESYSQRILTISQDANNLIEIQLSPYNALTFVVAKTGQSVVVITKSAPAVTIGQNTKLAASFSQGNFVFYVDGVLIGTDTDASKSVPTVSNIKFARYNSTTPFVGGVNDLKLYNTALTDAELITLTT